jgi:hypothetical protein
LVGDHLISSRDFGPNVIIFMDVYVVITVDMAWCSFAVKGFGLYGIIL